VLKPFFLQSCNGRLFVIYYPPATEVCRGAIVHVPAFAEEMNKSRHMVAKQAREFATLGYGTLVFDYYGTGDSDGEFSQARWEIWQHDLVQAIEWCREHVSQKITLWGLRFGALLAASFVGKVDFPIKQLMLWQPVSSGEQYMTQFLRLRLASGMMSGADKETVQDIKRRLDDGEEVEVAGYGVSGELYRTISEQTLTDYNLSDLSGVSWFEVNSKTRELSPVGKKAIASWQSKLLGVQNYQVVGSQFWNNQEIVFADQLIEKTTQHVGVGEAVNNGGITVEPV